MSKRTAALARRLSLGLGEARRDFGLSRELVAQMAGVSRSTVENVEHGEASLRSTAQVASALTTYGLFSGPPASEPELPVLELMPAPEDRIFGRTS
jgi:transcriptional regulator with XRE-family HTH domain